MTESVLAATVKIAHWTKEAWQAYSSFMRDLARTFCRTADWAIRPEVVAVVALLVLIILVAGAFPVF